MKLETDFTGISRSKIHIVLERYEIQFGSEPDRGAFSVPSDFVVVQNIRK